VQYLKVAWLKDPSTMPPAVAQHIAPVGLTTEDFQEILLTAHPLAAGKTADPPRYVKVSAVTYEPGGTKKETFTQEARSEQIGCVSVETSGSSGYSISGSAGFESALKQSISQQEKWTFTQSSDTCTSAAISLSAKLNLVEPSIDYIGPTEFGIYY